MSIDDSTIRFLKLRSSRWTGRAEQNLRGQQCVQDFSLQF